MVTFYAINVIMTWTYIHGWYFNVHSLEWVNVFGVYVHGSVIA